MRHRPISVAITGLAGVLALLMAGNASAQRGGHGGGGGGSHGGGGFHPASGGLGGAPNRTPSFSTPRPMEQPSVGPGLNRGLSTAPRQITPGQSFGNAGRMPGAVGP